MSDVVESPADVSAEISLLRDEGIEWGQELAAVDALASSSSLGPKRLRVAIFTENFLPKIDGVTRTVARLLQHLRLAGHEAILFGPDGGLTEYCGHPVIATQGIPLWGVYPSLKLNFFRPLFIRKLLEANVHVIMFVDPIWLGAQAMSACMTFAPNIPRVASFHTNLPSYASLFGFSRLEPVMWRLIRHLHDRCDVSFCPSASTRVVLQSKGFRNVRVWSRGVDTTLFNPARNSATQRQEFRIKSLEGSPKASTSEVVILYVGRLSWEKNLRLLVEAARGLRFPSSPDFTCRLVFVGDGPAKDAIASLCQRSHIPVSFMGHLRGEALASAFASADLFAFPSWSETFGQVVLEAMASGLCVVGLQSEGVSDLVADGLNGLLLNFDDLLPQAPVATAAAVFTPTNETFAVAVARYRQLLVDLIKDPVRRAEMGRQSRQRAMGFSWTRAMEAVVDTFQELRDERRAALIAAGLASASRNPSPRVGPVGSHDLSRVPTLDGGDVTEISRSSWVSSLAINASSVVLGRRYGRLGARPALKQWFGRTQPTMEAPTDFELEQEEAMSDQASFYKSSNLFPRLLIVAIVVWQLGLWTLKAAIVDVRAAITQ